MTISDRDFDAELEKRVAIEVQKTLDVILRLNADPSAALVAFTLSIDDAPVTVIEWEMSLSAMEGRATVRVPGLLIPGERSVILVNFGSGTYKATCWGARVSAGYSELVLRF